MLAALSTIAPLAKMLFSTVDKAIPDKDLAENPFQKQAAKALDFIKNATKGQRDIVTDFFAKIGTVRSESELKDADLLGAFLTDPSALDSDSQIKAQDLHAKLLMAAHNIKKGLGYTMSQMNDLKTAFELVQEYTRSGPEDKFC